MTNKGGFAGEVACCVVDSIWRVQDIVSLSDFVCGVGKYGCIGVGRERSARWW